MILIAESGATKTDWRLIQNDGRTRAAKTEGMNAAVMDAERIAASAARAKKLLGAENVSSIFIYAAGLVDGGRESEIFDRIFGELYPGATCGYASDLLACARAVCGYEPGIAAILGTGSNSCFYDGERIVKNVRTCGFILGDFGSAAVLGKRFVTDYLQNLIPAELAREFAATFEVDYATVVKNVYKGGSPAAYLGSFAPWIEAHYEGYEYVQKLMEDNFRDFIVRCIKQYDYRKYEVGVTGGFGVAYRELLQKVGREEGVSFGRFCAAPMDGLIDYHKNL